MYRTLETLQRPVDKWDDFLVFLTIQRLDSESVKVWEQHLGSAKEPPTWKQLCEFLVTRLLTLQAFEKSRGFKTGPKIHQPIMKTHFQVKNKINSDHSLPPCVICTSKHYLWGCPQYISQTVQQRYVLLSKHDRCYNCLGAHRVSDCRSTRRCTKCRHHTTIHKQQSHVNQENRPEPTKSTKPAATITAPSQVLHAATIQDFTPCILLATAQVIVINPDGSSLKIRALIDQGSEITLISERLVQTLRLPRAHSNIPLVGIGEQPPNKTRGYTSFKVTSIYEDMEAFDVSAHILPKLTSSIPSIQVDHHHWPHLDGLTLADPEFFQPRPVDLLIGVDIYSQIIKEGLKKGPGDSPIAQLTAFGWILSGPTTSRSLIRPSQSYHVTLDQKLFDLISKFWQLEEVSSNQSTTLSPEEQECENHYQATHTRDLNGRYVVCLPFQKSTQLLGNSRHKASKMLSSLRTKFKSDRKYAETYAEFMSEYEELHHMRLVSDKQPEPQPNYYLPHHGVWKENSTTTKLRVVFNGSSRTTSKVSLNEILHTGPKLQLEFLDVLIWFRQFRYVFSADIQKMYRQIKVHPQDWKFQRILWSQSEDHDKTYELTTVTYGLACAPFLALRTLSQLVEDEKKNFPLAVPCLTKGRYVDDVFGGADSPEMAQAQVNQLDRLCKAGGFPLQKWTSNLKAILKSLPQDMQNNKSRLFEQGSYVQALGLRWHPDSDTFHFSFEPPIIHSITKRTVLSLIAKLFDPLGLLAPVIIRAKILIQELWTLRLGWDDPLPSHLANTWFTFVQELKDINLVSIPRWIGLKTEHHIQLHGFCDASQQAALVYGRSINSEGYTTTRLIVSKTKVAPLKRLTIPRLELSGAVLLTKLMSHIIQVLGLTETPIFLWTDSSITLTWINKHPSKWKDYVQNRVVYIQETLPQAIWRFVPGKENPADLSTRGLSPSQLSSHVEWWEGPKWLSQSMDIWPNESPTCAITDDLEQRPTQISMLTTGKPQHPWELLTKYSTLTKLLRVTAMCMRAVAFFKHSDNKCFGPLTVSEIDNARKFWFKFTQQISFEPDIKLLAQGRPLSKSSSLIRLTPFLDEEGLLRSGGRLKNSALPEESKHLLILPKKSVLTTLIIAEAHLKTLHGGTQLTLTYIRQNYWIVGGRTPVRSFILRCIVCTRYRQQRAQQIMDQLPMKRVTPSVRPFLTSGVDYAGPFSIKTWRGKNARQYKAYIAVFVCFSTSATHLELVTDYSTDAFLAAYKRFVARRGICATLCSDCGTNFIGADKELQKLFSSSSEEFKTLATLLANDGTQWNFNPPSAPHFGGIWEAAVKATKYHLKRVVGNHLLTYEEMTTLTTQIEAVLNSRPLCSISDDPEDLTALTPGHFLIGDAPTVIPEPSFETVTCSRLSRWQLLRQMLDHFWSRWSRECLQRYHDIAKWNRQLPSLSKGSLVLIVDERYPPSKWPLGRIIDVHPGKDGHTRVVTVRTQAFIIKRPIVKLCPLPIEHTDS